MLFAIFTLTGKVFTPGGPIGFMQEKRMQDGESTISACQNVYRIGLWT